MAGISVLSFVIIQLPPGDFLTTYIMQLSASGMHVQQDLVDALKVQYGLDKPLYAQYWLWISGFVRGATWAGRSSGASRSPSCSRNGCR